MEASQTVDTRSLFDLEDERRKVIREQERCRDKDQWQELQKRKVWLAERIQWLLKLPVK